MAHPHSKMIRQVDNVEIDIASLAAQTGTLQAGKLDSARLNGFRSLRQSGIIQLDGTIRSSPTGGPLMVGINGPDQTLVELEEAIENDPQSSGDPLNEQARRPYFVLAYIPTGQPSDLMYARFRTNHKWS